MFDGNRGRQSKSKETRRYLPNFVEDGLDVGKLGTLQLEFIYHILTQITINWVPKYVHIATVNDLRVCVYVFAVKMESRNNVQ